MDQNTGYDGYSPESGGQTPQAPPAQNTGMQPPAYEQPYSGAPAGPAPGENWANTPPYGEQAAPPAQQGYSYPAPQDQTAPYSPPQTPAQPSASFGAPPPSPGGSSKKSGGSKVPVIILAVLLLGSIVGNVFQYVTSSNTVSDLNGRLTTAQSQLETANEEIDTLQEDLNTAHNESARLSDDYDQLVIEYEELVTASTLSGISGGNAEYFLSTLAFFNGQDFTNDDLDGVLYHTHNCPRLEVLEFVAVDEFIAILAEATPCPECH